MSLHPSLIKPVPEQTAQIARTAFPKGSSYLILRDELGTLYCDYDFSTFFPASGQPAFPPWRLALASILQFRESLSDRQTAEAVRAALNEIASIGPEWLHSMAPKALYERYSLLSQGIRSFRVHRTRYRRLAKTHLKQVVTAVATNFDRIAAWLVDRPLAATRTSHFAALAT